jgi:hypothetical protein
MERSRSSRTSQAPRSLPRAERNCQPGRRANCSRQGSCLSIRAPERLLASCGFAGEQALVGADVASALDRRSRSGWTSASPFIRASGTGGPDACSRPGGGVLSGRSSFCPETIGWRVIGPGAWLVPSRERSSEPYDPTWVKAQVGAERLHAETQPGPAATGAIASGRIRSSATERIGPDSDERFVANAIARQEQGDG